MADCKPASGVAQGQGTGLACTGQGFYSSIGSKTVGHQDNVTEHKVGDRNIYLALRLVCYYDTSPRGSHMLYRGIQDPEVKYRR